MPIAGAHTLVFAEDADAARAFFRDVLGFRWVDAHEGWLIFALPPGELAFHPADESGQHELYLMCTDIEATIDELEGKGVEFVVPLTREPFGLMTRLRVPGAGDIGLYQPSHPTPLDM
jgi:catechol 2,3-dioxygenase-like lactoylglutathione lyase family enzyme